MAEIIDARILDVAGVLGVTNVRVRSVGSKHFVEATIDVPRSLGLEPVADVKAEAANARARSSTTPT